MPTKRIVVLANSYKGSARQAGSRCVAGREIIHEGHTYRLGPWIRPVSGHGQGELDVLDRALTNRPGDVNVLDFIEMPLVEPAGNPCQPENWRLAGPKTWRDVTHQYRKPACDRLLESPADLWLEQGSRSDRIAHATLSGRLRQPAKAPFASLYVIRPGALRLRLYTNPWGKPRREAVFVYNTVEYALPITDPALEVWHDLRVPEAGQPPRELTLPCGDRCLLCVSLTDAFEGHHYKVCATVFENC